MKDIQIVTDKAAIGLSLLCAIHCLAFPLLMVLLPSLAALQLDNEAFHLWMLLAVVPTSAYALTMGCKRHQRYRLLALGFLGLTCLTLAVVLSETLLHETAYRESTEKILTSIGTGFIVYAHYRNFRLCQKLRRNQDEEHCAYP